MTDDATKVVEKPAEPTAEEQVKLLEAEVEKQTKRATAAEQLADEIRECSNRQVFEAMQRTKQEHDKNEAERSARMKAEAEAKALREKLKTLGGDERVDVVKSLRVEVAGLMKKLDAETQARVDAEELKNARGHELAKRIEHQKALENTLAGMQAARDLAVKQLADAKAEHALKVEALEEALREQDKQLVEVRNAANDFKQKWEAAKKAGGR